MWCSIFLDGNERLCFFLLNAILLKHTGIVEPVGEHDEERAEYFEIKIYMPFRSLHEHSDI